MLKTISFLIASTAVAFAAETFASPVEDSPGKAEQEIWNLENAYWDYVKANDLEKYRALWHDDFVGWPSVSSEPVRKDHITDWITSNTSKGLKLQSYEIERRAIKVTGDIAIDHYRIRVNWTKGKTDEAARTDAVRITHTWIRKGNTWQILGGMSAPVNSEGK
jgi:ketosteroid isomerase-like protein